MTYKVYNCNAYNIYTIKTDKFKTCHMEIIYRQKFAKENLAKAALLGDVLCENALNYPQHQDVVKRLEELYKASFWNVTVKMGQVIGNNFILDFINPEYINEENYLEEVLAFPFDILQNPNVVNNEFDTKTFKLCQKRCILDTKSIDDDSFRTCMNKALKLLGDTPSSYQNIGEVADFETLSPSSLYEYYQKFLKENACDIFIIGNLDMDKVVQIIKRNFHRRIINNTKLDFLVDNPLRKKVLQKSEVGNFMQANLVVLYNIKDMNDFERNIVFTIYNYILGSGGITSKLYQEIREKKSYCYAINSLYLKYDNLLAIQVSLDNQNCKDTIKLIQKTIKSMATGKFSEEEIDVAKQNYELALTMAMDNNISILNNYVFNVYMDFPILEERLKLIKQVKYDDVLKVAQKLKINTIFTLEGDEQNEGN